MADYAHGFRSLAEAIYLRDHITRQLEMADVATDPAEREARCTFVVVGAGYTGTGRLILLSRTDEQDQPSGRYRIRAGARRMQI